MSEIQKIMRMGIRVANITELNSFSEMVERRFGLEYQGPISWSMSGVTGTYWLHTFVSRERRYEIPPAAFKLAAACELYPVNLTDE